MQAPWLYVSAVLFGDRYRTTLGDLEPLMASIERFGQRYPIIVLDNHKLLAGERRLEALRRLGIRQVNVRTVSTVAEACQALLADARTVTDDATCLPLKLSERIAQVEPLYELRRREIERGTFHKAKIMRGRHHANEVGSLAANVLGVGETKYRLTRFALLITQGRRLVGRYPVSDLERQLARDALKAIDGGMGVETVIADLRAKLGYTKQRHIPLLPVDPNRTAADLDVKKGPSRPRKPFAPQFDNAAIGLVKATERLRKLTDDDRWPEHLRKLPPGTRSALVESHQWLASLIEKVESPNPKGTTP